MAGDRIDNLSEARQELRDHRPPTAAQAVPDISAGARPVHGVAGVDMDGIEADFGQLRRAERALAGLHDELVGHLKGAAELTGPLKDGTSPVTGPMRTLFQNRANTEEGVQSALLDYLEELVAVRVAILDTLATYEGVDHEAENRLHQQVAHLDQEVG